jgi:hypothetical protein
MDTVGLIPAAEAIPAPWWFLEFLGVLTLLLHFFFVNVALGGALIVWFSRVHGAFTGAEPLFPSLFRRKLPTTLALAINLGVAPLLFFQVLYGHFFYTSSIMMAWSWILVIPVLILGYYGAYVHATPGTGREVLGTAALTVTAIALLYIAFAFENNISFMLRPEAWQVYFRNAGGRHLALSDPALWARYLHFVTACVAVAGLFGALVQSFRGSRGENTTVDPKGGSGLKAFAYATTVQVFIGFWFLVALPEEVLKHFMGSNPLYTTLLLLGVALALGSILSAFNGKLRLTLGFLVPTVVVMVLMRTFLRYAYLEKAFRVEDLAVSLQNSVLAVFLLIFAAGLFVVWRMLRWAIGTTKGGIRLKRAAGL